MAMNILVACEESGIVTEAFRKKGHKAFSCDIVSTSGKHPEWHLQQNVIPLLKKQWDMVIAFPPCTHIAASGARWFKQKRKDGRQQQGINFFMQFTKVNCKQVAIENPVGIMSSIWRKPDQIVNPWQFGDSYRKTTCLWLRGLPVLKPTKIVSKGEIVTFKSGKSIPAWYANAFRLPSKERQRVRSRTFQGIANAMADQWG